MCLINKNLILIETHMDLRNLIINSVRFSVDSLNMLPKELSPWQYSEKLMVHTLAFGGIHSVHQPCSNWYSSEPQYIGHTFKP